jgi:hypothetical protein
MYVPIGKFIATVENPKNTRRIELPPHLMHARDVVIWLYDYMGYPAAHIALMLRLNPSIVTRTMQRRPSGWTPNNDSLLSRVLAK